MRSKDENKQLVEALKKQGFFDCEKVALERDAAKNVIGMGKVMKEAKGTHQSNIDEFNSQQHNHGFLLRKKDANYELMDVVVAVSGNKEYTRKMYVETAPKEKVKKVKETENK